jgi:RNA polymerase sigma-70 factor, ECF subfamily
LPASFVYCDVIGEAIGLAATVAGTQTETREARLAALFDAHHQRLYRLARRLTGNPDEARDLVQETFLRVARRPGGVPSGVVSEEAWLVRILVNVVRDGWRKRAGRKTLDDKHLAETVARAQAPPDAAVIARRTVWQALQRLPPRRRAALVLYELEGVGIDEIARSLGISRVTVRWHLSRGRHELARIIGVRGPS